VFHAVACGLSECLDVSTLLLLTPDELRDTVCGSLAVEWDAASLRRGVVWSNGYTSTSPQAAMLVDVLVAFTQLERRHFLQFVTGCPTLPPGGLRSLEPALKVIPRSDSRLTPREVEMSLPSASTCFHQIKLPPYSSAAQMRERLLAAIAGSKDCIDFT
jgi:hypothetical protein